MAVARASLGEQGFAEMLAQGRTMTLEQALDPREAVQMPSVRPVSPSSTRCSAHAVN